DAAPPATPLATRLANSSRVGAGDTRKARHRRTGPSAGVGRAQEACSRRLCGVDPAPWFNLALYRAPPSHVPQPPAGPDLGDRRRGPGRAEALPAAFR